MSSKHDPLSVKSTSIETKTKKGLITKSLAELSRNAVNLNPLREFQSQDQKKYKTLEKGIDENLLLSPNTENHTHSNAFEHLGDRNSRGYLKFSSKATEKNISIKNSFYIENL